MTSAEITDLIDRLTPFAESDADALNAIRDLEAATPSDADGSADADGDREAAVAKSLAVCRAIKSDDGLPVATRERAAKAARSLEAEHLAKSNPRAGAAWRETWQQTAA